MVATDLGDGVSNPRRDGLARSLRGRRRVPHPAPEPRDVLQVLEQRLSLRLHPVEPLEVATLLGLLQLPGQFGQPRAVGDQGLTVDDGLGG